MQKILYLCLMLSAVPCCSIFAQDALPDIMLKNSSGKIIVKWRNEYTGVIKTINIQRSYDSLRNFTTIGEVANPQKTENEYIDLRPSSDNMYYRIFIAFAGGNYVFSKVARPGRPDPDNISSYPSNYIYTGKENNVIVSLPYAETKKYLVKFFDDNNKLLFELNKLHDTRLIIEKGNFMHAGWFFFELYENGKLLEKNKVNILGEKQRP